MVLDHIGLLDETLQEFRPATAIKPALAEAALYTGLTHMFSGEFQDALPFLRGGPFSNSIQALNLWELGRKQEARPVIGELLKIAKSRSAGGGCVGGLNCQGCAARGKSTGRSKAKTMSMDNRAPVPVPKPFIPRPNLSDEVNRNTAQWEVEGGVYNVRGRKN